MMGGVTYIVTITVLIRRIPGAEGNSTMGILMVLVIFLVGVFVIPELYSKLLEITVRHLEPKLSTKVGLGLTEIIAPMVGTFNMPVEYYNVFGLEDNFFG